MKYSTELMMSSNFKVIQIQIVIFIGNISCGNGKEFLGIFLKNFKLNI